MKHYDAPTYRAYDNPTQQWEEWKRQANTLANSELRSHASVSASNRHACRNCFCCAAVELLAERRAAGIGTGCI